jgi:hypothetical protein
MTGLSKGSAFGVVAMIGALMAIIGVSFPWIQISSSDTLININGIDFFTMDKNSIYNSSLVHEIMDSIVQRGNNTNDWQAKIPMIMLICGALSAIIETVGIGANFNRACGIISLVLGAICVAIAIAFYVWCGDGFNAWYSKMITYDSSVTYGFMISAIGSAIMLLCGIIQTVFGNGKASRRPY